MPFGGSKRVLRRILPKELYPSSLIRNSVRRQTKLRVVRGPFEGMRYVDRSIWGAYIPKLLGTYELELHECIEQAISANPGHIVDIGGAEGYYAVGLLTRLPASRLTVFEQLEDGRQALAELARCNGVESRLEIRASCEPSGLAACLRATGASLVVCDVEGYEIELLDPTRVPELIGTDILVEVHDGRVERCGERIAERFGRSHRITQVRQRERTPADYPIHRLPWSLFPGTVVKYGLNEFRSPQTWWLWLQALQAGPATRND